MTRTAARDLGLRRVRSLTRGAAVGAVALTGLGAALAAANRPGHTTVRSASRLQPVRTRTATPSDGTNTGDRSQGDDENGTGADATPATDAPSTQQLTPPPTAPSAPSGSSSSNSSNSSNSSSGSGFSGLSGGNPSFGPSSGFGGGGGGSVVSGAS